MALSVDGILFDELTADPGSPVEGQVWYNTVDNLFKAFRNGATTSFVDAASLLAHTGNTSNPHSTTLEQARSAGNVLDGSIDMGGNVIANVGSGLLATDGTNRGWILDQIKQKLRGLDWQESVISRLSTPPATPAAEDRYLIIATASGDWLGQENSIAEWNGSDWEFIVPDEGFTTRVESENIIYTFDGASWGGIGSAVSHSSLLDLTEDDHLQYLPRTGVRSMTGDLDMGGQSVTNVNLVDGVDVSSHASRHNPGGADALATASAVTITDSTNAEGVAASYARSDHQHAHGDRAGGSLHALTSAGGHGFAPQSNFAAIADPAGTDDSGDGYVAGSLWVNTVSGATWVCVSPTLGGAVWEELTNIEGTLKNKAGRALAASFSGTPRKATVTFTTPFADADYAVTVTAATSGNVTYAPAVESQSQGSFVINLGSNNSGDLVAVNWFAVASGESA
jgi:hypothetical protein